MKQSLQLRMGQQLSMTPQLQQAIKLLQLSSLDLQLEIQQTLYSNPLLELAEEIEQQEESEKPDAEAANGESSDEWNKEIPEELPVDAQWDDIYTNAPAPAASSSAGPADDKDFETFHTVTESLQDHLLWQLNLTPMSELDRVIGAALIDNIDVNGFLENAIEDIWRSLVFGNDASTEPPLPSESESSVEKEVSNEALAAGTGQAGDAGIETPSHHGEHTEASEPAAVGAPAIELDEVVAVLHRIQQFDPPGVAAADLRDCLLIQLGQLSAETPHADHARLLVSDFLPLVAERDYGQLSRKTELDQQTLEAAIELIQSLSPRPGESIASGDVDYVVPDVSVRKIEGRWLVTLNGDVTPRLCINQAYASMVQRANDSRDNNFLRNNLQEARWFLRSLESRNETLLRVSRCIVEMQQEFLEKGPEAMRPMILAHVANQLDLHESTISRVTTQKYIDTPRGIFELKYFFSSHVNTANGGECSSTAIRAMLKRMISEEPTNKPLSDSKLATMLQDEGIQVARRTVAKYRESLNIPSSSDRKRFKQSA